MSEYNNVRDEHLKWKNAKKPSKNINNQQSPQDNKTVGKSSKL